MQIFAPFFGGAFSALRFIEKCQLGHEIAKTRKETGDDRIKGKSD